MAAGVASPSPSASRAAGRPDGIAHAPEPTPTAEPIADPELIPTACLSLGDIDCQRAADLAKQVLLETDPPVVYVQAGPFACREGDAVPDDPRSPGRRAT